MFIGKYTYRELKWVKIKRYFVAVVILKYLYETGCLFYAGIENVSYCFLYFQFWQNENQYF